MSAWFTLVKKELRLNAMLGILHISFLILMTGISLYISYKYEFALGFIFSLFLFIFHFFVHPIAMFHSLQKEWKLGKAPLWLNLPQSGLVLLLAKFTATLIHAVLTIFLTWGILLFMAYIDLRADFGQVAYDLFFNEVANNSWFFLWVFIQGPAMLAIITTLIIMFSKSIRKWGWLIGIGIVALGIWGYLYLDTLPFFQMLTHWGELNKGMFLSMHGSNDSFNISYQDGDSIFVGTLLFDFILMSIILFFSGWMLDRKVEL